MITGSLIFAVASHLKASTSGLSANFPRTLLILFFHSVNAIGEFFLYGGKYSQWVKYTSVLEDDLYALKLKNFILTR